MTNVIIKISELVELTTPASDDMLVIVDVSEPLDINKTKYIKTTNLTVNTAVILAAVYPIGSIYVSALSTNPATLFGFGTWSAFGAGRMPVGFDATQTEFDTGLETGGAKTHTLITAEMPVHTHVQTAHTHVQTAHTHLQNAHTHIQDAHNHIWGQLAKWWADWVSGSGVYGLSSEATEYGGSSATATNQNTTPTNQNTTPTNQNTTPTNQNTGSGTAHNNLPPYIVVYMWRRTA